MSDGTVPLLSRWRRRDGSEVVEVRRIWLSREGVTVRAHPVRGGRLLIADKDWFVENYEEVSR